MVIHLQNNDDVKSIWRGLMLNEIFTDDACREFLHDQVIGELNILPDVCEIIENGFDKNECLKVHHITLSSPLKMNTKSKIHFKKWEGKPGYSKTHKIAPGIGYVCHQKIKIAWTKIESEQIKRSYCEVWIDGKRINQLQMNRLAFNEGFSNVDEFFKKFNQNFEGYVLHWTNTKY